MAVKLPKEIEFAKWLYEEHFVLIDIIDGVHYFKSESWGNNTIDIVRLFNIFSLK